MEFFFAKFGGVHGICWRHKQAISKVFSAKIAFSPICQSIIENIRNLWQMIIGVSGMNPTIVLKLENCLYNIYVWYVCIPYMLGPAGWDERSTGFIHAVEVLKSESQEIPAPSLFRCFKNSHVRWMNFGFLHTDGSQNWPQWQISLIPFCTTVQAYSIQWQACTIDSFSVG